MQTDELCPGTRLECGSLGAIKTTEGVKYCVVCGRAQDGVDDGKVSRELAAQRLLEIHRLNKLLNPTE